MTERLKEPEKRYRVIVPIQMTWKDEIGVMTQSGSVVEIWRGVGIPTPDVCADAYEAAYGLAGLIPRRPEIPYNIEQDTIVKPGIPKLQRRLGGAVFGLYLRAQPSPREIIASNINSSE